ncbi:MAG: hypothetical protein JNM29_16545 [Candidatus Odyssella sp.]|nr:hypothetical protein [Candidatus Odyssella sp.]
MRPWQIACLGLAASAFSAAPAVAELRRDLRVLTAPSSARGHTFVAELGNAPYPVGPAAVDHRGAPFWHGVDAASGQRFRRLGENRYYLEAAVYSDARVLFHASRGFDPAKPFRVVLFLHGHGSEIEATVARHLDLPGQLDRSGANAVLVAPQLARDAQESAPGKFVEPGRAAAFFAEAEGVLRAVLGGDEAAWRRAPIVVAAYSGGYRTAAQILKHGDLDRRIEGLIMLDAFFADAGLYAGWLARHRQRAFLYALHTRSSVEETTALKTQLIERNIAYATRDDGGPLAGIRLIEVETPHGDVARLGPPAEPMGALLRRLQP